MTAYQNLIQKLDEFIRKYYKNQLIRGLIYAVTSLLVFYLLIIILEHFGRFGTGMRTFLFYSFIISSAIILSRWFFYPLSKLYRFGKIISHEQAAEIIGKHFAHVNDKLLNVLQLKSQELSASNLSNNLLEAAITQKINELKPVPFSAAIDLSENKKYLRWLVIPSLAFLVIIIAAPGMITEPTKRIVKHNEQFIPQAPFTITIDNEELTVPQQKDFILDASVSGSEIPDQIFIKIGQSTIRMEKTGRKSFRYTFKNVAADQRFTFYADGFESLSHLLKVLPNPMIVDFEVSLKYPAYLKRKDELVKNTGDITVPAGTKIQWTFQTKNTNSVKLLLPDSIVQLKQSDKDAYSATAFARNSFGYKVVSANEFLTNPDTLQYLLQVTPDQYPQINAESKRDTTSARHFYFAGNISDDFGFHGLWFCFSKPAMELIADDNPKRFADSEIRIPIPVSKELTQDNFFFHWNLDQYGIQPGMVVEYYFEVRDNDELNGYKSTRTQKKTIELPTTKQLKAEALKETDKIKQEMSSALKKTRDLQKQLNEMSRKLADKKNLNWEEMKKMRDLIDQQKDLQKNIEQLENKFKQNNEQKAELNKEEQDLLDKYQQLEELMKNIMSEEMKKKLEELEKAMENINKEKLQEALENMKMDTKEMEKEIDRSLELMKQMEVEEKMKEAIKELEQLAQKQENLSKESEQKGADSKDLEKKQDELNKAFEDLKKEMQDIEKKNSELEQPMNLDDLKKDQQEISNEQQKSSEQLQQKNNKKASQSQKKAADKMNEMAQKMQEKMDEQEDEGEDINALRDILENLIQVSFEQERIIQQTKSIDRNNPQFVKLTQDQKKIKDDAKMIEDSLFALSKRQPKISAFVNREIADINLNMDKGIKAMADRKMQDAASRQQYVMTGVNNLALMLSESLQQMMQQQQQNSSSKSGKGSCSKPGGGGGGGKKKTAAQMRAMQQQVNEQIQKLKEQLAKEKGEQQGGKEQGNKQGQQKGSQGQNGQQGDGGNMSEQLARLAAQQEALRREMQKMGNKMNENGKPGGNFAKMLEDMEKTETDLVNKRITQETIRRQQEILTRLLEAEKAEREQDMDEKRESKTGKIENNRNPEEYFQYKGLKQKEVEMLKTIPPAMNPYYKSKVSRYFSQSNKP
jgi:hypothetical protein